MNLDSLIAALQDLREKTGRGDLAVFWQERTGQSYACQVLDAETFIIPPDQGGDEGELVAVLSYQ